MRTRTFALLRQLGLLVVTSGSFMTAEAADPPAGAVVIEPFKNITPDKPWQEAMDLGSGQSAPGFEMRVKSTQVKLDLPDELANWNGKTAIKLHLYNGGPAGAQMVIQIMPRGNEAGSYWWTRITADWQGWKDVELSIVPRDVNTGFVPSNKGADKLPDDFATVKEIVIRNQWGAAGPGSETWTIAEPSQAVWGLDRIEVK